MATIQTNRVSLFRWDHADCSAHTDGSFRIRLMDGYGTEFALIHGTREELEQLSFTIEKLLAEYDRYLENSDV